MPPLSSVTSFCPGHISGYFKRIDGPNLSSTGSIGSGIVIDEGVSVTVSKSEVMSISINRIDFSGSKIEICRDAPTISYVLDKLGVTAKIVTECRLPFEAGFGLSAAALLGTLYASNKLFDLKLSSKEIVQYAHDSEIIHKAGLGDVSASQNGGMVVRRGVGVNAPIERTFDLPEHFYAVSFGPIPTPSILQSSDSMKRLELAWPAAFPNDIFEFFSLSRQFSEKSELLTPELREVLKDCDDHKIPASMTIIGNGIFAYGTSAKTILANYGEVYGFPVATSGPRIIGEN